MERLTSRNEDCVSVNGHGLYHLTMTEVVQMADRLADYEDMDSKRIRRRYGMAVPDVLHAPQKARAGHGRRDSH